MEQSGDNWKLVYKYSILRSTSTFEINFKIGEIFEINPRARNIKVMNKEFRLKLGNLPKYVLENILGCGQF